LNDDEQTFNLFTYKLHALGHYPSMIQQFGTTDSYSTQTVMLLSIHPSLSHIVLLCNI
jgi:hypothetical protein